MLSTKTQSQSSQTVMATSKLKKPNRKGFFVNFIAGGIAGTTGVIVTCPLDVVQTRLQSSLVKLAPGTPINSSTVNGSSRFGLLVYSYMRHVVKTEGFFSLYKGLVPNLLGIAPSRAVYFAVYNKMKGTLVSTHLANSSTTHMLSALTASWTVSTLTNPIWFVKTKIQLDMSAKGQRPSISHVVKYLVFVL